MITRPPSGGLCNIVCASEHDPAACGMVEKVGPQVGMAVKLVFCEGKGAVAAVEEGIELLTAAGCSTLSANQKINNGLVQSLKS